MADREYFVHSVNIGYSPTNDSKPIIESGDTVDFKIRYTVQSFATTTINVPIINVSGTVFDSIGNTNSMFSETDTEDFFTLEPGEQKVFEKDWKDSFIASESNNGVVGYINAKGENSDGLVFDVRISVNEKRSIALHDSVGNDYNIQTSSTEVLRNDKKITDDIPYRFFEVPTSDVTNHFYFLDGVNQNKYYSPTSDIFFAIFECKTDTYQNDTASFNFGLNSISNCQFFERHEYSDRGSLVFAKGSMAFVIVKNNKYIYPISGSGTGGGLGSSVMTDLEKKILTFRIFRNSNGTSNIKSLVINGLMSLNIPNYDNSKAICSGLIPSTYGGKDVIEDGTLIYDSTNECLVFRHINGIYDFYDCVHGTYHLRTMVDNDGNIVKRDMELVVQLDPVFFQTVIPLSLLLDGIHICYGIDGKKDEQMFSNHECTYFQIDDSVISRVVPDVVVSYEFN